MSKPWNPGKPSAAVKPSRIRREPVRLESDVPARRVARRSDEQETWLGVAGVLLFAAALVVVIVGISVATFSKYDPAAAAKARRFAQCYDADGPNCVLDGDTIYVAGAKVEIAGLEAPQIQRARCPAERTQGIDAAVRLQNLLNSGRVTVSRPIRDADGREVRKVLVKGHDVRDAMIGAGVARRYDGKNKGWC